ncbi:cell division protein ZapE, partial [Stenotrophomonas maltophilia]
MLASLVPPPQFDEATFDSYRSDPAYPSQEDAKQTLMRFAGGSAPVKRAGLFRRAPKEPETKPGVYLDGGFGVGKTHLLASIYHAMPARRKYFGSFIEYTALVGALGYKNTVDLLRGADLLCIDEFELDDPGDTMVMTRLLGELVGSGTRLAVTSNTPPNALGEGRFAAQDFLREIQALAARFEVLRVDGEDYRHRAVVTDSAPLPEDAVRAAVAGRPGATLDGFDDLLGHLSQVHPSRYRALLDGVEVVALTGVHTVTEQSAALRLVVLVVTTPDLPHERLLGGFVADLFDDRPYTFCVTEQGLAGP